MNDSEWYATAYALRASNPARLPFHKTHWVCEKWGNYRKDLPQLFSSISGAKTARASLNVGYFWPVGTTFEIVEMKITIKDPSNG